MKMSSNSSISKELSDNVKIVLGKNVKVAFKCKVRMETKSDKTENKILIFSSWRVYVMPVKIPSKVEHHFHYSDIQGLESKKRNQLSIILGDKTYTFYTIENDDTVDDLIQQLIIAVKIIFPLTPLEHIIRKIEISPASRLQDVNNKCQENVEVGPCGGFSVQYACMCDYHGLPYRDEVAWDVDTIYLSHDSRELSLQDFDQLEPRDLIPIISVLEYNTWFTKFRASNIRLLPDAVEQLLNAIRKSVCIEEIYLDGVGLRWEFVHRLSAVLMLNTHSVLHTIDLSSNLIEDKGAPHLVNALIKLPKGLKHLNLAKTGLTAKGVNMLANALAVNKFMASTLTFLSLADNTLKDDVNNLYNFLAQPNTITHLDLSGTDVALDMLFGAILRGCIQKLSNLNLSRNPFSHKKPRDVVVPTAFKQFFMTTVALRHLNLSSTKLPPEALKNMLLGLTCNELATNIEIDLSSNNLSSSGAQIMENCLADVRCLSSLDLSDNSLDSDVIHVVNAICKNKFLRRLHIGRNFSNIKSKYMPSVMESLVQLIQEDDSVIEHLSLADSKLKGDINCILNALGSNQCLISVDISGNQMGDAGAGLLAKALQINNRLKALFYDRNGITANGYHDLAYALQLNYSMRFIPYPIYDVCAAVKVNPDRTDSALKRIENLLHRNVSPKKYNNSQAFRLQQGFLLSSTQQMVDRLVVQTQDLINTLKCRSSGDSLPDIVFTAEEYLKDADKSKQLLTRLHNVILQREEPSTSIDLKLNQLADELHRVIQNHLQGSVNCMIKCAEDQCPSVLGDTKLCQDLQKSCQEKSCFPASTVQQSVVEQAGTDIMNKVNELNLVVASHLSDRIVDEVIESLSKNYKILAGITQRHNSISNVTLRKGSADSSEKLDSPEITPQLSNKRKSVQTRKLRPQSIVDPVDSLDSESMNSYIIGVIKESSEDTSPQRLSHLSKARPRRQKTHAATKANVRTETIVEDENTLNVGLDIFFQKSEPNTPVISPLSSSDKTPDFGKKSDKALKSDKSSAEKKAHKEKSSDPEKKEKGGRLVQELSNMFSRRSDRMSKSKSIEAMEKSRDADPPAREIQEMIEAEKDSLSSSESNLRQPSAIPKIGVGNTVLAEMKALQEKRFSQIKETDKTEEASKNMCKSPTNDLPKEEKGNGANGKQNFQRPMSSPGEVPGNSHKSPELKSSPGIKRVSIGKSKPPPIAPKPRPRSMISPDMRRSGEFSPTSDTSSYDGSISTTPDNSDRYEDSLDSGLVGLTDSPTQMSVDLGAKSGDVESSKRKAASLPRTASSEMVVESHTRARSLSQKELVGNDSIQDALQLKNDNDLKLDSGFHVDDVVDV